MYLRKCNQSRIGIRFEARDKLKTRVQGIIDPGSGEANVSPVRINSLAQKRIVKLIGAKGATKIHSYLKASIG